MRICFIMGRSGHYPCGGFKIVYEYTNRLAQRGHRVTVVHPTTPYPYPSRIHQLKILYHFLRRLMGLDGGYRPDSWFKMDPRVKLTWVPSLHERWIPLGDIIVATAWQTAEWVYSYSADRGKKFYFIQHWETVFSHDDPQRAVSTYLLPLKKIVIARWLLDKLAELGKTAVYIPNGLDFDAFGIDTPIEKRKPTNLMMLYHQFDWKGVPEALAAVQQAKVQIPEIRLTMFGVYDRPENLPSWVEYYRQPEQRLLRRLYNQAAIFINASWVEGWGLTPCEAAQCGAALCLTDNGGHREFGIHEETALLSPPRDPEALAANIVRLVEDQELRLRLARQGHRYVQQFTWERSVSDLEKFFSENI